MSVNVFLCLLLKAMDHPDELFKIIIIFNILHLHLYLAI